LPDIELVPRLKYLGLYGDFEAGGDASDSLFAESSRILEKVADTRRRASNQFCNVSLLRDPVMSLKQVQAEATPGLNSKFSFSHIFLLPLACRHAFTVKLLYAIDASEGVLNRDSGQRKSEVMIDKKSRATRRLRTDGRSVN
jgi:hypothetical protein